MLISILILAALGMIFGLGLGWAAIRFRVNSDPMVEWIDALLPQTQCGQCGYPGCRPYAEAISNEEADINKCPPGGDAGIRALADLLGCEPKPLNPENGEDKPKTVVVIDEQRCIGCLLCIQVCPVDAIVGAAKLMHTVIASECTACKLCLPPCPVDCIDIVEVEPVTVRANGISRPGNGVWALNHKDIAEAHTEMPCIRCGECARVCPALLFPQQLHLQIKNRLRDRAAESGLSDCIECGNCDLVCPSRIPLVDWFRYGKGEQRNRALESAATGLARKRFGDRQARLLRIKQEQAGKMTRRKQMLQDKTEQQDRIRASIARAENKSHQRGGRQDSGKTDDA